MTRTLYEALGPDTSKRAFVHYPAGTYPGQTRDFADKHALILTVPIRSPNAFIEGNEESRSRTGEHLKIDPAYNPRHIPDDGEYFPLERFTVHGNRETGWKLKESYIKRLYEN